MIPLLLCPVLSTWLLPLKRVLYEYVITLWLTNVIEITLCFVVKKLIFKFFGSWLSLPQNY